MMKNDQNQSKMGLYVHVPFCIKKCAYCDFYSLASQSLHQGYINALYKQMKNLSRVYSDRFFDTVYLGGGTPTILDNENLKKLLDCVNGFFKIQKDCEFTVEANPATLDLQKLETMLDLGVNRLSIGCQSANDEELQVLGRSHTFADFVATYELARKAGFKNISVDLMYAIPDQTFDKLKKSLESIVELGAEHISLYGLKIEPDTLFYKNKDVLNFPNEDEFCDMYLGATNFLQSCGYEKYEISNFSKPSFESRHNLRYWQMKDYLGLGPGAHSFVDGRRFAYAKDLLGYINDIDQDNEPKRSEDRIISSKDLLSEEFMLSMRLTEGYDLDERLDIDQHKLDLFVKYGYIERRGKNVRFTDSGFLISNYLLSELLDFE